LQIAVQLALVYAKIARLDFPSQVKAGHTAERSGIEKQKPVISATSAGVCIIQKHTRH
jgi:hypothetical protein